MVRLINFFNINKEDAVIIAKIVNQAYMFGTEDFATVHAKLLKTYNVYVPEEIFRLLGKIADVQEDYDIGRSQHKVKGE